MYQYGDNARARLWKGLCLLTWVLVGVLIAGWQWYTWRTIQAQSVTEIVKAVNALHMRLEKLEQPSAGNGGSPP